MAEYSGPVDHRTDGGEYASILFFATCLVHSLGIGNFYWVAVFCAAVLQGSELKVIFHRHVQRIVGDMVGIDIGIFLFSLQFSTLETVVVLIVLNLFVEYAMVRNYGWAASSALPEPY